MKYLSSGGEWGVGRGEAMAASSGYEMLRELMRKVECGEAEILNMSITQEYPENAVNFVQLDSGRVEMVRTSRSVVNIDLKVGITGEKPRSIKKRTSTPQEPISPLRYGARKLDID